MGLLRDREYLGRNPGAKNYQVFAPYDERGVVYICWDAEGNPVYVGQTVRWPLRRKEQMRSTWWASVAVIHIIPAPDRVHRCCSERSLILTLVPSANISGLPGRHKALCDQREWIRNLPQDKRSEMWVADHEAGTARARANLAAAKAGKGPIEVGSPISNVPPWVADPGSFEPRPTPRYKDAYVSKAVVDAMTAAAQRRISVDPGGGKTARDRLAVVADLYMMAIESGRDPSTRPSTYVHLALVGAGEVVSRSAVRGRIERARGLGLVPPPRSST